MFHNRLFSPKLKAPLHVIYIILVVTAMGLSVPRLFMKNQPRTRANTIALGMGAKSLIIIAYELSTDHIRSLQRWRSYKAYFILNALEVVFWGAVTFLVMQSNLSVCKGISCTLSWVVVGLSIVISTIASHLAIVCFLDYRLRRNASRNEPGSDQSDSQCELASVHVDESGAKIGGGARQTAWNDR